MEPLNIKLTTLTPLWTGGVKMTTDRLHETGIIGSLRWWYEGIVRGMGGRVCDVTADDPSKRCIFEQKKTETFDDAYARLCLACRLFGCTSWRRQFRLEVEGPVPQDLFFTASSGVYVAAGNWLWRIFGGKDLGGTKQGRGAAMTFTFGVQALWGDQATLHIVPLGTDAEATLARIAFLLDIMTHWGALGAKPQHGFGQIQITSGLDPTLVEKGCRLIADEIQHDGKQPSPQADFFNLDSFFSHTYQLPQTERYLRGLREIGTPPRDFNYRQHFIPCAFDIRYKSRSKDFRTDRGENFGMRPWFREKWGTVVAHRLFGRSDARPDEDRSAGRIHVSHLHRKNDAWYLKVWGHVPSNLKDNKGNPISVENVAGQVTAFVQAMFPDSKLVDEFKRWKVLGR